MEIPLFIYHTHEGFFEISQLLVDSGCKINVRNNVGETPLHSAVHRKHVADVKLLLKNNAEVNIQDGYGNTPLHISSHEGFFEISQLLVDAGCKINRRDISGETPLHSAVHRKHVADVELLLKNNADANIQNTSGNTPLHTSLRRGFSNISQLLIDSGCNRNLKNREGKRPLDLEPFPPLSGDEEDLWYKGNKGNKGYAFASLKGFVESEDEGDPWMNQPTRSTLSSPIVGKRKEQSSTEESDVSLKNRQELL